MFASALKSFSSNITANYSIAQNPTSIAGAWKVYDAKGKKTGKVVSVFVFDRKSLDNVGGGFDRGSSSSSSARRKINDEVVERLKKEASSLARLRHPNILELAEPVEDTRSGGLMFATEPITATLAGLLADQDNKDKGRSRNTRYKRDEDGEQKELELDELEIQKGLLQVAKGLQFLHESANLVHANVTPEAVYINHKSDWKISGLGFAGPPDESTSSTPSTAPPIALSELLYYDPRLPKTVQLDINYTSPDFVMDTNISSAADMFSFGLLLLALYNSPHESPLHTNGNVSTYKKIFQSSSTVPSASNNFLSSKPLPRQLQADVLPRLITRRPAQRMTAREFQESSFFDNVLVSTIRFLEALPAKTPNEKSQFMRGFPRVIDQFPKSVLSKKVLPALLEETKDKELLALILTNAFKIITVIPTAQRVFVDKILPKLREVFLSTPPAKGPGPERDTAKEAGLVVVLENMRLIADTCNGKEFKDDILPIIALSLDSPTHSLVDKALSCLSIILSVLDFSTIKNELFPVVATVFSKTSSLAIKVRGLEAFVVLCGGSKDGEETSSKVNSSTILDKYTVQEKIVPLMKGIKTKEPAVMMAALKVFRQIGRIADSEFLAMDVLPVMWAFSLGPLLNLQQFRQYMDLIKSLSSRIEQEQTRKLRDLASNNANGAEDFEKSNDLMSLGPSAKTPFSPTGSVGEDDFERLVLGKGSSQPTATSSTTFADQSPFAAHPGTPAQNFGWNSTSSSTNNALKPQSTNSRAITPDQSLSAFTPLSPSATAMNMPVRPIQPMQSSQPTTANPWAQPMQPQASFAMNNTWSSQPSSASSSAFGAASTSSAAGWTMSPPPQAQNQYGSNYMNGSSAFSGMNSTTNNNMNSGMGNGGFGQQNTMRPIQPARATSAFNIAPPPGGGMGTGQQNQAQGQKKSGLDAYDSLI